MKIKPLVLILRANKKSQLNPNCRLLSSHSHVVLIAVWRLVMLSLLLGREKDEGCDSHLLIVTGRGWTPARKRAIISLRCSYCQNFNTATKSILQGQIQKSLSKLQHTEECVLGYRLFYYKDCSDNFNWNPAGFDKLF